MSTLIGRLRGLLIANAHESIDQLEDPATMSRQVLRELDAEVQRCRQALVQALATEKELGRRLEALHTEADRWGLSARELLARGQDADARALLRRQLGARHDHATLEHQHQRSQRATGRLRDQLRRLRDEQIQARSQCSLIALKLRAGQALESCQAGLDAYTATLQRRDRLAEYARRAGASEDLAEASAELCDEDQEARSAVDARLCDHELDAAMEALRAELLDANEKEPNS